MFRSNHTVDLSLSIERRRGAPARSERHKVDFETTRPGTLGRWIDTARGGNDIVITDPAQLVPVRIDPELLDSLRSRAARDHTTNSEVIRAALREYLAS